MPNGKVGDHWYTDVVVHKLPSFSAEVDALIREIDELVRDPRNATEPPCEPFEHPYRQRAEAVVEAHLNRVGYDTLTERGNTIGMAWRHLSEEELRAVEADLRSLRDALSA
jgi:hypothetical protein